MHALVGVTVCMSSDDSSGHHGLLCLPPHGPKETLGSGHLHLQQPGPQRLLGLQAAFLLFSSLDVRKISIVLSGLERNLPTRISNFESHQVASHSSASTAGIVLFANGTPKAGGPCAMKWSKRATTQKLWKMSVGAARTKTTSPFSQT